MKIKQITKLINNSMIALKKESRIVKVENINESVFRHLFIKEMYNIFKNSIEYETEWLKIDLMVKENKCLSLFEFKLYFQNFSRNRPCKLKKRPKGYSGKKNKSETINNIIKLSNFTNRYNFKNITDKYLLIVYADLVKSKNGSSNYSRFYNELKYVSKSIKSINIDDYEFHWGLLDTSLEKTNKQNIEILNN